VFSLQKLARVFLFTSILYIFLLSIIFSHLSSQQQHDDAYQQLPFPFNMQRDNSLRGPERMVKIAPSREINQEILNINGVSVKREYEEQYPPNDFRRSKEYVYKKLRRPYEYQTFLQTKDNNLQDYYYYDIYNCPSTPPEHYPFAWNSMDVLQNWNPGNTTEPERLHHSLCVFDYSNETSFQMAQTYQKAELPFLIRNIPELLQTAERWNRPFTTDNNNDKDDENNTHQQSSHEYLSKLLQGQKEMAEHADNPHFMYFKTQHVIQLPNGWQPPMEILHDMTFDEWYERALAVTTDDYHQERYYFRFNGGPLPQHPHQFLYNELPIFDINPNSNNFFMVDPSEARGINCRFGMKGIIAETHYDQSRNFIVVMGGQRRYILAHPQECSKMALYPVNHPSGRHSAIDWISYTEDADQKRRFPQFAKAQLSEVVLQAGDALYLPTFWFHFIVSLNVNYQCNARSGMTYENVKYIDDCGFKLPRIQASTNNKMPVCI